MLDILLATQNLPFTIAITVALLIGVIEIFALLVGAGDEYYGGGCCWYVDIEDIEEFKANWIDIKKRIQ